MYMTSVYGGQERSPDIRVMIGCKLPFDYWKPNLGPLQEQQVLLPTEPNLQYEGHLFNQVDFGLICGIVMAN